MDGWMDGWMGGWLGVWMDGRMDEPGHAILQYCSTGLDGAAFQSRLPANKLTKQEMVFFPDISGSSQSAIMEFLFIRNRLLQTWLQDPVHELTTDKAQAAVHLPHPGE